MPLIAITCGVSSSINRCELMHLERQAIDVRRARQQHEDYESLLGRLGCTVHSLPVDEAHPDSVFVEDTALVLDELAILLRPGAASRRGETLRIDYHLRRFRPLRRLQAPARLDGGDILRLGRTLYLGETSRSNAAAVTQIRALVEPLGYEVRNVPVNGALHLKSAATAIADNCVLINPQMVRETAFAGAQLLPVDPAEPFAANALRVGQVLVYSQAFPKTAALLAAKGAPLEILDVSELAKAEGALTCCSLIFEANPKARR